QLLRPVRDRLGAIPERQRAALLGALGSGDPVAADRFLVSVAILSLLADIAEDRPFERLGATPWADQARAELRATGETARQRDPSLATRLTPQELQIVRLVGTGATNREVAGQLFLSARTVDYHLHKVFTKVGVSSRTRCGCARSTTRCIDQ